MPPEVLPRLCTGQHLRRRVSNMNASFYQAPDAQLSSSVGASEIVMLTGRTLYCSRDAILLSVSDGAWENFRVVRSEISPALQ